MNSPYLPLWWGWAPDCCRRTAGQPLRSASSWWRARMGWALNRFDYIPEADLVQTPDLLMGPLMFLEPVSCSLSPRIHPTPCWCCFFFPTSVVSPHPLPPLAFPPQVCCSRRVPAGLSSRTVWQLLQFANVTHPSDPPSPSPPAPPPPLQHYNHLLPPATATPPPVPKKACPLSSPTLVAVVSLPGSVWTEAPVSMQTNSGWSLWQIWWDQWYIQGGVLKWNELILIFYHGVWNHCTYCAHPKSIKSCFPVYAPKFCFKASMRIEVKQLKCCFLQNDSSSHVLAWWRNMDIVFGDLKWDVKYIKSINIKWRW